MFTLPLSLLSPAGPTARLSILIFHRVLPQHDPLNPDEPDAAEFERRLRWAKSWFNVLPLREAAGRLRDGRLPARALSITFDDGYADNQEVAAPILERLGLSATFFIATGYLDGGCMWNDCVIEAVRRHRGDSLDLRDQGLGQHPMSTPGERRTAVLSLIRAIKHLEPPERARRTREIEQACGGHSAPPLMMSTDQLRRLRARGMEIGGHTVTHPILTRLPADEALREMRDGRERLQALLDAPVTLFAYPNGVPGQDYAAEHVAMARACGFEAAVSTSWGAARQDSDLFQLPRFTPWDKTRTRFGARMIGNLARGRPQLA